MRAIYTILATVVALILLVPAAQAEIVIVRASAPWRFWDQGTAPAADWNTLGFDDSSWFQGSPPFGYGEDDEVTLISFGSDPNDKHITTWFRHEFSVADPLQIQNLRLRILRDDGILVYLNGTEVVRSNMDPGPIAPTKPAKSEVKAEQETWFFSFDVDPALLVAGTNVLAVELHQANPASTDLSLELDLYANVTPSIVRGPYIQNTREDGVTLCWRTDVATESRVWVGTQPGVLDQTGQIPTPVQDHFVPLSGLLPGTKYWYAVGTDTQFLAGDTPDHVFRTAPTKGTTDPFRVWVLGDSGSADGSAAAVRDAYYDHTGDAWTDLVLLLGDNAYEEGTDGEYEFAVFQMYDQLLVKAPFWPTRGNHESLEADYLGIFEMPISGEAGGLPSGTEKYYSFDYANAHFVCLDSHSSDRSVGGAMWTWAEADLASTNQDWIVAFWHHPPYSKGSHDSDTELKLVEMRENFLPLLEAHGVDLVLAGHSHSYERSFLINGHYDVSGTFDPATMLLDGGDGRRGGDGVYLKKLGDPAGATYITAGCSGKVSGSGALDHPVMFYSALSLGSAVLSFDGGVLDVEFLNDSGVVEDHFTMRKELTLSGTTGSISLSGGGSHALDLETSVGLAGDIYWIFGSASGTEPVLDLGKGALLPLVYDGYTQLTVYRPFAGIFGQFIGTLDATGAATATLTLPPGLDPTLAGVRLWHAAVTATNLGFPEFASNAVGVTLAP